MAIERNFTGFEFGDFGELNVGTGGVISGALNTIVAGGRSGAFYYKLANATNAANLASFPAGSIVGTSGTVTSGNHKRVSVRLYARIESAGSTGHIRMFGFGDDAGTCTVHFGNINTSGGFLQAGTRVGIRIGSQSFNAGAGAMVFGTTDLATGVWYRFLLDVDLDVGATTVLSATLRVTEDVERPVIDFTITNSLNIGATDALNKFALGYSDAFIGAFGRSATFNYDDIVYIATSDADAASGQPTLPTQTHIYAIVPPTGHALLSAGWTGTYANVDEYPLSGADTMSSSTAAAEVEFSHASGIALGYSQIQAMKLYVNAIISGGGTGAVNYVLNGTPKAVTLGGNYPPSSGSVDPIGGVLFSTLTPAAFAATTFGLQKNNGTQLTIIGNIGLEVIGTLAAFGSGNQIRGETQIKRGSIYDDQLSDVASVQPRKIQGGAFPVFLELDGSVDDVLVMSAPLSSIVTPRGNVCAACLHDEAVVDDAILAAHPAPPSWVKVAYSSGDFSTNDAGATITVASGDITSFKYLLLGRSLYININISGFSLSGTSAATTQVRVKLPGGLIAVGDHTFVVRVTDNGVTENGDAVVPNGGDKILFRRANPGAQWNNSTDNSNVSAVIGPIEV